MKTGLIVLAAVALLTGCTESKREQRKRELPRQMAEFYDGFSCDAKLTAVQETVCANDDLYDLESTLLQQWSKMREGALTREERRAIYYQQRDFLREREACADTKCVEDVYYRYIREPIYEGAGPLPGPVPTATPKPKPKPKPKPIKKPAKPVKKPGWHEEVRDWDREESNRGCRGELGVEQAARLQEQCLNVTRGLAQRCDATRSCSSLRYEISRGCKDMARKPKYCQ